MANERRTHPFIQFSLRGPVIMVVVAGILLGVLVAWVQREKQRNNVDWSKFEKN